MGSKVAQHGQAQCTLMACDYMWLTVTACTARHEHVVVRLNCFDRLCGADVRCDSRGWPSLLAASALQPCLLPVKQALIMLSMLLGV